MDKPIKPTAEAVGLKNGIYVKGMVISNSARKITRKDGTTSVMVKHELSIEPGMAVLDRFIDPANDTSVRIEGEEVKLFPKLKKYEPVMVWVGRFREYNNQFHASDWEIVD